MKKSGRALVAGAWFTIAGMILATAASAQRTPPLYVGVKAGITSSSWSGVASGEQSRKEGFTGGGFLTYTLSDYFYVQGEALYTQRGTELVSGTFALDYFEVPLLLGIQYDARTVIARIYGGMSLGFKVGCDDGGQPCGDEWNRMDLSVPIGGAFDVVLGRTRLGIDLRIALGLTDLNGDALGSFKSRAGSATIGAAFPIG